MIFGYPRCVEVGKMSLSLSYSSMSFFVRGKSDFYHRKRRREKRGKEIGKF